MTREEHGTIFICKCLERSSICRRCVAYVQVPLQVTGKVFLDESGILSTIQFRRYIVEVGKLDFLVEFEKGKLVYKFSAFSMVKEMGLKAVCATHFHELLSNQNETVQARTLIERRLMDPGRDFSKAKKFQISAQMKARK